MVSSHNKKVVDDLIEAGDMDALEEKMRTWRGQTHVSEAAKERVEYYEEMIEPKQLKGVEFELYVAKKYQQVYGSAKARGKEFSLTLADVRSLLKKKTCSYTGAHFTKTGPNSRTFERVDGDGPYSKDNVIAVTYKANQIKNELFEHKESKLFTTHKEIANMLKVIKSFSKG